MNKLIAVDVDGTLLNDDHQILSNTKGSIIRAMQAGHKVVIVSGRPTEAILPIAKELSFEKYGGLISSYNGGVITNFKTGEKVTNHTLNIDLAKEILEKTKNFDVFPLITNEYTMLSNKENAFLTVETQILGLEPLIIEDLSHAIDFNPHKIIFVNYPQKIDELIPFLEENFSDRTSQVRSLRSFYEIMPKNLSKGNSLIEIANHYGINQKDIIAFGDAQNDISMFEMAATPIAMANADDIIKEMASYITLSNNENGIGYYLDKFVL
ncbi:Cof-type HAD-IIB family hydrolase [Anaerococcus nagyae]|uniref:Cof-type HAD-IIB family hydrolase n=1 Tax=Anaerococcus nagyae TaxID=1755241 RepID=UPI0037350508